MVELNHGLSLFFMFASGKVGQLLHDFKVGAADMF
jgi:hypothetical protein